MSETSDDEVGLIRRANPAATIYLGGGMDLPLEYPQGTGSDAFRSMRPAHFRKGHGVQCLDFNCLDFNAGDESGIVPVPGGEANRKARWGRWEIAAGGLISAAQQVERRDACGEASAPAGPRSHGGGAER